MELEFALPDRLPAIRTGRPTAGAKFDANGEEFAHTQYAQFPQNRNRYTHSQGKMKNFGGTISYVQRLPKEPPEW